MMCNIILANGKGTFKYRLTTDRIAELDICVFKKGHFLYKKPEAGAKVTFTRVEVKLPSVCSPPHPHDTDGFNTFELNSFGRYVDEAPLLLSIHRDRVKGRAVAELGEHSVGQLRGRARAADVVDEEARTAAPTARTTDFSISVSEK